MNDPETDSPDDYDELVECICSEAAEEFRRCIADPSEQRRVTCRYFRSGSRADISHPELIDFLGVSTPSVLDRAGYSDEQAQHVMDMLATITDEEFSATQPRSAMPTPQDFIAQYGSQVFNHSDVLLGGLRDGSIHFESASADSLQLNRAYLDIYQFRLEHLRKTSSSDHARAIAADVEDLCVHLAEHPESPCDLWIFSQSPHFSYSVFVTRDCRLVAGCIRGVDARLLSEPELARLWGRQ